jgi:hypothetical protein
MKTRFFFGPDTARLRKALVLLMIAVVVIAISIPGLYLSKGNSLFAFLYFAGFILFFYALLHPWQKAGYYAITIPIFLGLLILIIKDPGIFVKIPGHGAEDLAWAIGGIFFAGLIAGIIGIIRCRIYKYDDDDQK